MALTDESLVDYAEALAFVGNSLLETVNHTGALGLDHAFWESFPDFADDGVKAAVGALVSFAVDAQDRMGQGIDVATEASVEFTRLFVGPPKPAAAPWETFYRVPEGAESQVTAGFGKPTFEMQQLLRDAGLQVSNDNNQYADHMGIELLYASELARRAAVGQAAPGGSVPTRADVASFAADHPLAWIERFRQAVAEAAPDGYYVRILDLAKALLKLA